MRIAIISTPFVPVPPPAYGGTELIVAELAEGLREVGHTVRLYTCGVEDGDAGDGNGVRSLYRQPVWPPSPYHEMQHCAWAAFDLHDELRGERPRDEEPRDGRRQRGQPAPRPGFDVVHTHCPSSLPLARLHGAPLVYSVHHARDEQMAAFYARQREARFTCVSRRQRELLPEVAGRDDVVHHGLDEKRYPLGAGGGPALFIGRLAPEKAPHLAIDVARAAGSAIVLGGRPHPADGAYFEAQVRPRLVHPGVTWLGEIDSARKLPLLAAARALLFPVAWEEPFGLVMIEAMLSGTPVLAFPRGAVPEVVDEGVTGFICRDAAQMAERLRALGGGGFDRARCRRRAVERFSRARMVADYLNVYARAVSGTANRAPHGAPEPGLRVAGGLGIGIR